MRAQELRTAWLNFFAERGHKVYPSAGLIPHHRRAPLFTNAGMNQFLPYILGEEPPPDPPRATSVQKNVRVKGKHDDIEEVGRSPWHLSFFEMMGNFSFGDYFKEGAIPYAWELVTEVYGLDGDRIWVTVYETDDDAADIWHDTVGVPTERIQRLGNDDNFWEMGETGPCGPCSELFYDMGEEFGEGGGPAHGAEKRFPEFWNLVFMQYDRQSDGTLADLPMKVIDTGAGLERNLVLLQDVPTVWDTDELARLVTAAASATGRRYGDDADADLQLRILADHGRTISFMVNDGIYPSNEDRGYVVRRIVRRAVRKAYQLGVEKPVTPQLVAATAEVMGDAYPELLRNVDFVTEVVAREEERFRQTLKSGSSLLEQEIAGGATAISGDVAFKLHDTFGFPIELTREIAAERNVEVDMEGFDEAMAVQRLRARDARKTGADGEVDIDSYRELIDQFGPTEFTGYQEYESTARVLAVMAAADGKAQVFLDRTPFYAEGGGQVGDTGTIAGERGTARVLDTTYALPGLNRHTVEVDGNIEVGDEVVAHVDEERREAIRRNHTGTHLLHWALREVLGAHVKQQGSLVAPEYLRFDFSHFGPVTPEELERVEDLVNARVLANEPVRAYETSKAHAEQLGAIAFFGDKYGEYVRVVEAGSRSLELCGGTHVGALGMIGPIKVTAEQSIGANMRRIFALTGAGALERVREEEKVLSRAADLLKAQPDELPDAIERVLERQRALADENKTLRAQSAKGDASRLAGEAANGKVVTRVDGIEANDLRDLAVTTRDLPGVDAVVLIGSPDGSRVALVGASTKDSGIAVNEIVAAAATITGGGGGGKNANLAVAGGKDPGKIDDALASVRAALGLG
jgi:alanyl-tRNA synthetase